MIWTFLTIWTSSVISSVTATHREPCPPPRSGMAIMQRHKYNEFLRGLDEEVGQREAKLRKLTDYAKVQPSSDKADVFERISAMEKYLGLTEYIQKKRDKEGTEKLVPTVDKPGPAVSENEHFVDEEEEEVFPLSFISTLDSPFSTVRMFEKRGWKPIDKAFGTHLSKLQELVNLDFQLPLENSDLPDILHDAMQ